MPWENGGGAALVSLESLPGSVDNEFMVARKIQTCAAAVVLMLGGCGQKYWVHDSPDADFKKDQEDCKEEAAVELGPRPATPSSGQTDPAEQIFYDNGFEKLFNKCMHARGWHMTTK